VGRECGLTVRKNTGSLEIFCDVVYGRDSYGLLFDAFYEACWLAHVLEEKFDMRLGRPSLSRKPHFAVSDPLARLVGRYFEFSSDVAKVDESEGLGELDILDPQLAYDYLLMPSRVEHMEERLERLEKIQEHQIMVMETFAKAMEEHRAMINEIRELVDQLKRLRS